MDPTVPSPSEWNHFGIHPEEPLKERTMGPYPEYILAEHEYRREQFIDARRTREARKAARRRTARLARLAQREARAQLIRVA